MSKQKYTEQEKERTLRLIDFLRQIATIRYKSVRKVDDYEKHIWFCKLPKEPGCHTLAWGKDEEHDPDIWLEIQKGKEPPLPAVPAKCKPWVDQEELHRKDDLPSLLSRIKEDIPNPDWSEGSDIPKSVALDRKIEDFPDVLKLWQDYVEEKWKPWVTFHSRWKKVNDFYSTLFSIYLQQLRLGEEYELVVGFGLLSWKAPSGYSVLRHLVVADVMLDFDAQHGRLILRPHTEGAKLRSELDMLDVEDQPENAAKLIQDFGDTGEDDPWEIGSVEGVLKALVHSIDPAGEYDESLEPIHRVTLQKPCVDWAPALILRKRSTKGLTETLKDIRAQLEQEGNIPENFAMVAELDSEQAPADEEPDHGIIEGYDGELFFPKPANREQERIARLLESSFGVLVQGPPGTGKSHTIANLICHLLATGQRTLITAKTPRALQVLERLVPEELRSLCVNLLGDGPDERRALESSVQGILSRQQTWNPRQAEARHQELEKQLKELNKEKAVIERRLLNIREAETRNHHVAGGYYKGSAARIAERVNREWDNFSWFTDTVPLEGACPISVSDLQGTLGELRFFNAQKCTELKAFWNISDSSDEAITLLLEIFPSREHFITLVNEEQYARQAMEENKGADETLVARLSSCNREKIEQLQNDLMSLYNKLNQLAIHSENWTNHAIEDILSENSGNWKMIAKSMTDNLSLLETHASLVDTTIISIPDKDINILHQDAVILYKHMHNGGGLGWAMFRPTVVKERKYFLDKVRIDGVPCSSKEDFAKVALVLEVRSKSNELWKIWDTYYTKILNSYDDQTKFFKGLLSRLNNILSLEELVDKCHADVLTIPGLPTPVWDVNSIMQYVEACRMAMAIFRTQKASQAIQRLESLAHPTNCKISSHPHINELVSAVRNRDVEKYAHSLSELSSLRADCIRFMALHGTLNSLRSQLPQLTDALMASPHDEYWAKRIQQIEKAWYWAQANRWLKDCVESEDSPALEKRMFQIDGEISSIITELAAINAWDFCFSRMENTHRQHMTAWQQSMKRLGKGTGKQAHRHRRDAQAHLNACREAVPAWVMPLHRIWDTVKPARALFDVIIVDEASQCGMESLPLLYMAKKIVIVGDDKQISPEAVGIERDAVENLKRQFLFDFSFKSSFDVESSLFDLGMLHYGCNRITLREHFRSMPEIIRFSNELCYSNTPLIPLRQYGQDRLPPLEHIFVENGFRKGSGARVTNEPEAEALVSKIRELCHDYRYRDKSMGVIVLQGEGQARLIEELLLQEIGAEEMEQRHLVCGNPYNFQGDERDIIFLSMVAAGNDTLGTLSKDSDIRRFNVAASRARDQLFLFHSVTANELSPMCLRRRLIEFFEQTRPCEFAGINVAELEQQALRDNRSIVKPQTPFDSWFEVDVALELLRRGYRVLPQYEVAGKFIDLVIDGGQSRLAVECDGDHWHGPDEYETDMLRQRQLERCGWHFFRVRESAFYCDKEQAMAALWPLLEERGIFPCSRVSVEDDEENVTFTSHEGKNNPEMERRRLSSESEEQDIGKSVADDELQSSENINSINTMDNSQVLYHKKDNIEVQNGDTVLYVDIESPDKEKQVQITNLESNPEWGFININTPIAQALIGEHVGSIVEALLPRGVSRLLIKKIVRMEHSTS